MTAMRHELDKVEIVYDTVAKEYAEAFSDEHEKKPKDQEVLRRFATEIGDREPVWDLGCGPGHTATYLKNLGVEISGLDLSEKSLEQARALHPEIHFQKGNLLDLQLDDNSIAGAVAFYAIVHFTEAEVAIAFLEVYRVLRPGGLFLLTFHIGDEPIHVDEFLGKQVDIEFSFFSTAFIHDCLKETGFERIELVEREPYPDVEYESRRAYVFATKPEDKRDSIVEGEAKLELTDAQKAELDRRLARRDSSNSRGSDWADVRARILGES